MTQFHEMTDAELMEIAESWLDNELRRIPAKLGLTPAQMMRVVFRCTGRYVEKYLRTLQGEDDEG